MTRQTFTASVTYRVTNEAGELETKTVAQDVTDEIAQLGDDSQVREELADRVYWNNVHGTPGFFDIVFGGVIES